MKCSICNAEITDMGNNPSPVRNGEHDRCCDRCNERYVIPLRFIFMHKEVTSKLSPTEIQVIEDMGVTELDNMLGYNK